MPEISEGTEVVTPCGNIGEIGDVHKKDHFEVIAPDGMLGNRQIKKDDLVKVDQPIRVRVSRECYAESLVALAEEAFARPMEEAILQPECVDFPNAIKIDPDKKEWCWYPDCVNDEFEVEHDLTYRDNLPQIEAWLQANGESEDECETCGDRGYVFPERSQVMAGKQPHIRDCPNCTDESEEDDEPQPEDEEWLEDLKQSVCGGLSGDDKERLGFYGMTIEDIVLTLAEHIDDLESEIQSIKELCNEYGLPENEPDGSCNEVKLTEFIRSQFQELQDVREEIFHKESYIQRLRERLNNSRNALRNKQERIEELELQISKARHQVNVALVSDNEKDLFKVKRILPNVHESNEGDGCGE